VWGGRVPVPVVSSLLTSAATDVEVVGFGVVEMLRSRERREGFGLVRGVSHSGKELR
jgi:hypothetical protein